MKELGPDSKSQVTLEYIKGKPVRATSVVVSTQHSANTSQERVREIVLPHIENILPEGWMPSADELYINPTGQFIIGGPDGDTGMTGRKIIVDAYGGRPNMVEEPFPEKTQQRSIVQQLMPQDIWQKML